MHYIGIDLAWTYANESRICVIADNGYWNHLLGVQGFQRRNDWGYRQSHNML